MFMRVSLTVIIRSYVAAFLDSRMKYLQSYYYQQLLWQKLLK